MTTTRQLRNSKPVDILYHLNMAFECICQKFIDKEFPDVNARPTHEELVSIFIAYLFDKGVTVPTGDEYISQVLTVDKVLAENDFYHAANLYYREALLAHRDGLENAAWSFLADALYMIGFHNGFKRSLSQSYLDRKVDVSADLSLVEEQIQAVVRSKIGKGGGEEKGKKYDPVVEYIFEQVIEQRPPQEGWKSPLSAAEKIHANVQNWSKSKLTRPLSVENSANYVYRKILADKSRFNQLNLGLPHE